MINRTTTDEELEELSTVTDMIYGVSIADMAKELQAYRKAFSEPEAWLWVKTDDYGRDVSLLDPEQDEDAADAEHNGWTAYPLSRKPEV